VSAGRQSDLGTTSAAAGHKRDELGVHRNAHLATLFFRPEEHRRLVERAMIGELGASLAQIGIASLSRKIGASVITSLANK
jgi:hypothetical protein